MEIIKLLKQRDQQGLSLLYDDYSNSLMGVIMSIVRHQETAEEILQETFLKVWNSIDSFNEERGTLFTWMVTIARRMAIDKVRLKSYGSSVGLEYFDRASDTPNHDEMDTHQLLKSLDKDQKVVLDMVYLKGYTQQQASEMLEIPLGTVKSRIRLAIKSLRSELDTERSLFLGSIILIILTIMNLWI